MNVLKQLDSLKQLTNDVLVKIKNKGATAATVNFSTGSGFSTTVRLGKTETVEFNRDKSLSITVYKGKRKGTVSGSDLSEQALNDAIEAAFNIAKYTEEDQYAGLADPKRMAKNIADLNLYHPTEITPEQAMDSALKCEDVARKYSDKIINSEGTTFSTAAGATVYGNSHGFIGGYPSSRYSLSCAVIAGDNGLMQVDHDYTIARDLNDLEAIEKIGNTAAERAVKRLNSRKIKTTKVPVIFNADMATGLFGHLLAAISGGNLYRKSSFLVDHLGKQVFPEFIQIEEQPHLLKRLGSRAFDNDGVATENKNIIHDGKLSSYLLGAYSARKLGMETTANAGGAHNVTVQLGNKNLQQLIKAMNKGLIITELLGHGINLVNGDYSRGASGFWVENGQIQYPVSEITVAGNLKDMFSNIVEVGNDLDNRGNILTGSVLIENMMIAGE